MNVLREEVGRGEFTILLAVISKVTRMGQREIGLTPLVRTLKTPRLIHVGGLEAEAIEPSVHEICQSRSRIFDHLSVGGACRRRFTIAPADDPVPGAGGIAIIEPNLRYRPCGTGFLESSKDAGIAVFTRFHFHDQARSPVGWQRQSAESWLTCTKLSHRRGMSSFIVSK